MSLLDLFRTSFEGVDEIDLLLMVFFTLRSASLSQYCEYSHSNGFSMIGDNDGHFETFCRLLDLGCFFIRAAFLTSSRH